MARQHLRFRYIRCWTFTLGKHRLCRKTSGHVGDWVALTLYAPASQIVGNTRRAEIAADICLCIGIFIEWILIGGFPLIRPRRWWLEPTVLITFCSVLGAVSELISSYEISRILMLTTAALWCCYLLLLLWKPVYLAWQSTLHGLGRLS